nr:type II toxin-antitoxin system RelE/ParE family toxin [uncultured Rhodopila sp.]
MSITGPNTSRRVGSPPTLDRDVVSNAAAKALTRLQAAVVLSDLRNPPSNHFEASGGDRKGQYSIRINKKNRVCFKWAPHSTVPAGTDALQASGDAYDVEIVIDYH